MVYIILYLSQIHVWILAMIPKLLPSGVVKLWLLLDRIAISNKTGSLNVLSMVGSSILHYASLTGTGPEDP